MTKIYDFAMMIAMDLQRISPSTQIVLTIITLVALILMLQKTVEIYTDIFRTVTSNNNRKQRINKLLEEVEREVYGYSNSNDDYSIR